MTPFEYLRDCVKFYLRRSETHGVGLFALVNIKEGEEVLISSDNLDYVEKAKD